MSKRGQHHRDLFGIRQVSDELTSVVDHQLRVDKNITFRVPDRILSHVDQRCYFRKQLFQRSKLSQPFQTNRWPSSSQQQLFNLAPNAFSRKVRQIDPATEFNCFRFDLEFEAGSELGGAQDSETVFSKGVLRHRAQNLSIDICATVEGVD